MSKSKALRDVARLLAPYASRSSSSWIDRSVRRQTCIFCGGTPVNGEHIWPRWSHRYLPKTKKKWWAMNAIERHDRTDINIVKRPGDPYDRKSFCVDERCNNGWMRQLENEVRPIIRRLLESEDNSTRITEGEQRTIASWIAIKAIVSEYEPHATRVTHHAQIRRLAQKQEISPRTWRIWIGNYEGRKAEALWICHPFLLIPDRVARRKKSDIATYTNSSTITYVIGKLLIHIMHCPYEVAVRRWQFPPQVGGKLRQIWPTTGLSIVWPTPSLSDGEAQLAASAFKAFIVRAKAAHAAHT